MNMLMTQRRDAHELAALRTPVLSSHTTTSRTTCTRGSDVDALHMLSGERAPMKAALATDLLCLLPYPLVDTH